MSRRQRTFIGPQGMGGLVSMWGVSSLIKSVQRGTITLTGAATGTATITSVATENAVLMYLGNTCDVAASTDSQLAWCRVSLTNATTITATRQNVTGNCVVAFEIIEYLPGVIKSIQIGTVSIANLTASNTAAITGVNTEKSVLMYLGAQVQNTTGNTIDSWNRLTLTNATTITATRIGTASINQIGYQIVECF